MNRDIRGLLHGMGLAPAGALLIDNTSVVSLRGDSPPGHGFKLALLDSRGRITHFCKCGPADADWLKGAAEKVQTLRTDPLIAKRLMPVRSGATSTIRVLVSPYARGGDWHSRVKKMAPHEWMEASHRILEFAAYVGTVSADLFEDMQSEEPIRIASEAEPMFRLLERLGTAPETLAEIHQTMSTAQPVAPAVQHGDLWAPNILQTGKGWKLTDFELLGEVRVPLYDAFHFVQTSLAVRSRCRNGRYSWLETMRSKRKDVKLAKQLLRRQAQGLNANQRVAVALFYVVDIAGRLALRHAPQEAQARYTEEVELFAKAISSGESLDRTLYG